MSETTQSWHFNL